MKNLILHRMIIGLIWVGVFVAGTLSVSHLTGIMFYCSSGSSCQDMLRSNSSYFAGIPVAYYGLGAYSFLALLAGLRILDPSRYKLYIHISLYFTGLGALVSLMLMQRMLFVLHDFCPWCLASATIFISLFVLHLILKNAKSFIPVTKKFDEALYFVFCFLSIGGVATQFWQESEQVKQAEKKANREFQTDLQSVVQHPSRLLGPLNAKVTVIEFADMYCSACRNAYKTMLKFYNRKEVSIRFGYCHFPQGHQASSDLNFIAAMISEYAGGQGKFWQFLDAIYSKEMSQVETSEQLYELASKLGIDQKVLKKELSCKDCCFEACVRRDIASAKRIGLAMTPTFVIFAEGLPVRTATYATIKDILTHPPYSSLISPNAEEFK